MQLKKKVISLLVGISLVALGMFTSCGNPSGGTDGNEKETEVFEPDLKLENDKEGIKISWGSLPSKVKHLRIQTVINSRDYDLFEVNDLSEYPSITDVNVTKGNSYEYRIIYLDNNFNWIATTDWKNIKATGGKGEKQFTAEPTDEGIKFGFTETIPDNLYSAGLEKFENGIMCRYYLYDGALDSEGCFTDKFVDNGSEYEYRLILTVGTPRHWDKGNEIPADSLVEYPRYKPVTVKAKTGSGNIKTKTLPEATFNSENKTITITKRPEFSNNPENWDIWLNYRNSNRGVRTFVNFNSSQSDKNEKTINENIPDGLWTFEECWISMYFGNYRYEYGEYNLPAVEAEILLNVKKEDLFIPTAKPTENGILILWDKSKIPANTKRIWLQCTDGFFEITDPNITSVLNEYVEAGKTYEYYISAEDQNYNQLIQSEKVRAKATGGKGKLKIQDKISITYSVQDGEVTFSDTPSFTGNLSEWSMNFNYKASDGKYDSLFGVNSDYFNMVNHLYTVPNDTWTFDGYWINDNTNSAYRYCHYEESLDAFTEFPETITVTDSYKPKLTATAVNNGIKFQWENVPDELNYFCIHLERKDKSSIIEYKVDSTLKSFVVENVSVGKTYRCCVLIRKTNTHLIYSDYIEITPTNGKGEVVITNSPAGSLDGNDKVNFTTAPQVSGLSSEQEWTAEFRYTLGNNGHRGLYRYYSNSNLTTGAIETYAESGTWKLGEYCVWFNTDDFEYFNYVSDISKLSGMPQTIVINKVN